MPYLVHRSNGQVNLLSGEYLGAKPKIPSRLRLVYDTEFTAKGKLTTDSIQIYSPDLNKNLAIVWGYDELTPNFNPWICSLEVFGFQVRSLTADELNELYTDLVDLYDPLVDGLQPRKLKTVFKTAVETGYFDDFLCKWKLNREYLQSKPVKGAKGQFNPEINVPKLIIDFEGFFGDVDLFKLLGSFFQYLYLDSPLQARRCIKSGDRNLITTHNPIYIDDQLYEVQIRLRDVMNRFPPVKKGLADQCETLKANHQKVDVETPELASKLGLKSPTDIKVNMSLFREKDPDTFYQYAAGDVFATHALSERQQQYLDEIRADFKLNSTEICDTTGSNVSRFLVDLILKHFDATEGDRKATVTQQRKLANADNLQKRRLNDWGCQTTQTVGGLLFSRVARYPVLKGFFGDLDESSCYATKLSNMNIYLGEPIVTTFKGKKYKPTLTEALQVISEQKCPRDSWFIRVSGKLDKAENTLILSDLGFTPKQIKFKTIWDKNPYQPNLEEFNAYKTSDVEAVSTLLRKQIKFGLINADILDCLKLLPENWYKEFLDLKVDALVFIPEDLICNDLNELENIRSNYELDEYAEKLDLKTGLKQIYAIRSKANVCLKFPISNYYKQLKAKRSKYKDAKNPIQEIYKLFLNSGYGALACRHLAINNLLAANQITASARAASWLMINALNGLQVITDGATFSWEHIPLGLKFKDLLQANPTYLIDFNPSIKSNLTNNNFSQTWINEKFKQHLYNFYQIDETHIPANLYEFELKTEKFVDYRNKVHETTLFTHFHNTGSGNYSKGLNGSHILINGSEYNFIDQHRPVKARSFKGENPELLRWYIDSLERSYKSPRIDSENQIIKFSDGCKLAIKYLKQVEKIAFPCGFSQTKYKLMKLITRSQFLFLNEKQLRNFERTNQLGKLDILSKSLLTKNYWNNVKLENLTHYGVTELREDCNYWEYAKEHPIGIGFELLSYNRTHKGSIESVRNLIADKIQEGVENFGKSLNIEYQLPLAHVFTNLFAAAIVLRANAEANLKDILVNSVGQPTITVVTEENVKTLAELRPDFWLTEE